MRLGSKVFEKTTNAQDWAAAVRRAGFSAAYCPVGLDADDATVRAYEQAARDANIVIAEVGAWSSPIDPDPAKAAAALEKCKKALALADRIGARCCVNIAGSRSAEKWDGPHQENLSDETFDMIVQSVRQIVDAVKPKRSAYALETMPWIFPDSPDSYLALIKAIDRPGFAVHLDPVNMINCPSRAYRTGDFLRECFAKLGPHIRGCHGKDIRFVQHLTIHLDECRPGQGVLDYAVFLRELSRLHPDTPLMLEHMPSPEEYSLAADHIRHVAKDTGLHFV